MRDATYRGILVLGAAMALIGACESSAGRVSDGFGAGGGPEGDGDSGDGGGGDGSTSSGGGEDDGGSGGSTTGASSGGTSSGGTGDEGSTGGGATGDGGSDGDGGDIKFDVQNADDLPPPDTEGEQGCGKIDFLFVVDNSGSMEDEQSNLVTSFPGFLDSIRNTVMVEDVHIMAIDSDAATGAGTMTCSPAPACCVDWCANNPDWICNGEPCTAPGSDCDVTLGAGKTLDQNSNDCGIVGGSRYMVEGQPDLDGTFSCVATVGTGGDGNERPMEGMVEAVTTQSEPGQCNEGFVRDDAILVVTYITDEEDNGKSAGNPTTWKDALVSAKGGNENAVVVLGLVGDTDLPNAVCLPYGGGGDGAEDAPTLREFADSFVYGMWAAVCEPDYAPFFDQAVSVIDTACEEFEPPG